MIDEDDEKITPYNAYDILTECHKQSYDNAKMLYMVCDNLADVNLQLLNGHQREIELKKVIYAQNKYLKELKDIVLEMAKQVETLKKQISR